MGGWADGRAKALWGQQEVIHVRVSSKGTRCTLVWKLPFGYPAQSRGRADMCQANPRKRPCCFPSFLLSFLLSSLPSFIPSFFSLPSFPPPFFSSFLLLSVLPSFHPYPPFFLPSFIPSFHPYPPFFLPSFLPSFLLSSLPSFIPSFFSSFLPSFLLSFFLPPFRPLQPMAEAENYV